MQSGRKASYELGCSSSSSSLLLEHGYSSIDRLQPSLMMQTTFRKCSWVTIKIVSYYNCLVFFCQWDWDDHECDELRFTGSSTLLNIQAWKTFIYSFISTVLNLFSKHAHCHWLCQLQTKEMSSEHHTMAIAHKSGVTEQVEKEYASQHHDQQNTAVHSGGEECHYRGTSASCTMSWSPMTRKEICTKGMQGGKLLPANSHCGHNREGSSYRLEY